MRRVPGCVLWNLLVLLALFVVRPDSVRAQGGFTNFELPMVHGVTVAPVGSRTFVAACNPEDNSVTLIDAVTDQVAQRIPVGLGPVSVKFDAPTSRLYTANLLGDSITIIELADAATPGTVLRTMGVGDEPTDLAFRRPSGSAPELWVTLGSSSRLIRVDPDSLGLLDEVTVVDPSLRVMKYPYRLEIQGGFAYILNLFGRSRAASGALANGFELLRWDFAAGLVPVSELLGSSHLGMRISSDGTIYVVGNDARNDIQGEPALRVAATGFVESHVWALNDSPPLFFDRDLNANVARTQTVSMPTDIALVEDGAGVVQRAFVASFSTDRVVELVRGSNPANIATWSVTTRDLVPEPGYSMVGPRSFALVELGSQLKLYVACRLDAQVRVLDVTNPGLTTLQSPIPLPDPFPQEHRDGQALFYDARLSDNGSDMDGDFSTVSCASCHLDGKTDGLAWELDTGDESAPEPTLPVPPELADGIDITPGGSFDNSLMRENRGPMVSQTLQGLRTSPAIRWDDGDAHPLLSTRPFYWRGVRRTFLEFGPAFDALLGRPLASSSSEMDDLMREFRDFAFTIMYPPNPEQPPDRIYSGHPGTPGNLHDGTGALRGLKLFHEMSLDTPPDPSAGTSAGGPNPVFIGEETAGRSCMHCHALPSGTNGLLSERRGPNVIKTAQLRGLRARESTFEPLLTAGTNLGAGQPVAPHGLFHDSSLTTVNRLILDQFNPAIVVPPPPNPVDIIDLILFSREFDTGIAPMVGMCVTLEDGLLPGTTEVTAWSNFLQVFAVSQVERANVDIVVERVVGGTAESLYWDVVVGGFVDPTQPQPQPSSPLYTFVGSNPLLVPLVAGERITVQAVPIGDGRRIASPGGQAVVQGNDAPMSISSISLVVPDPFTDITSFTGNLGASFNWQKSAPSPRTVDGLADLQNALDAAGGILPTGLTVPYHEAPRRFRVEGDGLSPGAKLTIFLPTSWSTSGPPTPTSWDAGTTLDLHPVTDGTTTYWETAATFGPRVTYAMAAGWFAAPGVATAFHGDFAAGSPPPGPLDPAQHNRVFFAVSNENPTAAPPAVPEPFILHGPVPLTFE
ncbi:MAG: hypothetical protein AAF533_11750 [Acidobacteriota bacterium]